MWPGPPSTNSGVTSISAYNSAAQPAWVRRQMDARRAPPPPGRGRGGSPGPQAAPEQTHTAPPPPPRDIPRQNRAGKSPFAGLAGLLPEGMDTGDLLLVVILLFLYTESRDEDFLIILIVVAPSLFKKDRDSL